MTKDSSAKRKAGKRKPEKLSFTQDFIPIKNLEHGIIETTDGRYIKILEIEPINFMLRSEEEQYEIICSFASWLKISPVHLQFKSITRKADSDKHIAMLRKEMATEESEQCKKLSEGYIRLITFVQGIESVGGVDISLTEAEAAYINKFNKGGITCVAGQNHLDGRAALEYARCRKIDSDWQRVKRQRNVIQAAVNSTKDLSISELNDLMNQVFPLVQTNLSKLEITELLMLAPKCRGASIQQITIPIKDSYGGMTGLGGRSLFSVDFDTNAQALREFMYGENSDS